MKRKLKDIMNDMDKIEKVEITDDLLDDLRDYFKEEIESEKITDSDNEKVASGLHKDNLWNEDHGQQERI